MASAPDCTPLPHMISPMTEVEERSALSPEVGTTRVEAFSDSVMAGVIPAMRFPLRCPPRAAPDARRDPRVLLLSAGAGARPGGSPWFSCGFSGGVALLLFVPERGFPRR